MNNSTKLILALLGAVVCVLVARQLIPEKKDPVTLLESELSYSVYYNNSFNISLKDKVKVAAPTFTIDTKELKLHDSKQIKANFTLPKELQTSEIYSFSVFSRVPNSSRDTTIFIALKAQLLEYRCQMTDNLEIVDCPPVPMIHNISNVISVHYDAKAGLSFVAFNETNTDRIVIQMAAGDDISKVIDQVITNGSCNKLIFSPEYTQLGCVRTSGISLDAYFYSNTSKNLTYETFTASSLGIQSLDDFVFDTLANYVNSGIIRVKSDLLFVRNEVKRRFNNPFGDQTEDFRIYAAFPKLILTSKSLNKIIQYDYSSIDNLKSEGEYNLFGCQLSNESSIYLSHNVDMFFLTCQKNDSSSHLYIFNPSSMNLRQVIPLKSINKSQFRYALLNNVQENFDFIFFLDNSGLAAQTIYSVPILVGNSNNLTPMNETTLHTISFTIRATSTLPDQASEVIRGQVTVIFPERPIETVSSQITLEAQEKNGSYEIYFHNNQLFNGSVHNLSFELIPSSKQGDISWQFIPITDLTSSILVPNISSTETIYDYHYLPVKSDSNKLNDGIFVLLTTDDQTHRGYLSTYRVLRENHTSNFDKVEFINKFTIDDPYCTMLTIINIGEFSLDNVFGFVQCSVKKLALYGYALANGTKILDESIVSSEAWINFAFDDVNGQLVVFHSSLDQTSNFIEFLQFYPVGQKFNNPVKVIPFSQLQLEKREVFQPAGYDLIVNPNSQTFEIYSISLDGTLVYCSTPFNNIPVSPSLKGGDREFCVKQKISELVNTGVTVKPAAWNGLQIIKDYNQLSAIYRTGYNYSNGLQFVINSETTTAYMFKTVQSEGLKGTELSASTQFQVLKGFADYYPDYKKLTFFNVDDKYVMFVAHTLKDNNEFVYIVFDHDLDEKNSSHYHNTNKNGLSFPILEATGGKRYRSTDVGLSPTRVFTENPSPSERRVVTFGANNSLLQFYVSQSNTLRINGECVEAQFVVTARNDRFQDQTVLKVSCPKSRPVTV